VDKIRSRSGSNRDVSGEGVQQALLKMLDGADISVTPPGGRRGMSETITLNTRDILFVVSGAFVGLSKIIEKSETNGSPTIGFGAVVASDKTMTDRRVKAEHLIQFGLIPEFVGRLPVVAVLDELNEDQLVHVLTEPKNAIVRQYRALFSLDKVEFDISDEALRAIAKLAIKQKTGARGLLGVMEDKLVDVQYHLPDWSKAGAYKVHVGQNVFDDNQEPVVLYNT
jgi:ATP-dependent Clp protease ATP-binding subunit ClpX